ncbi:MAG: helix-turn-helix domain-containing protein [Chloroflexota bacterium]|nr:helix-turn-helix domain-containing protein [Chloroflexota bacterium]
MFEIETLTTGQVARYCHVSQATILNWIKKGKLKAYATPGGHHRILLPDFLSFLEAYEMPVDSTLKILSRPRVLIVSDGPHATVLVQTLQGDGRFDVARASSDYEASAQVARLEPNVVVLDKTSATLDCLALCRWLRALPEGETISVLVVGDSEDEEIARAAGANAYLSSAAVADRLKVELETLLEAR